MDNQNQRRGDLMLLHAMAISNVPTSIDERDKRMAEYQAHRRACTERYGAPATFAAEHHGVFE